MSPKTRPKLAVVAYTRVSEQGRRSNEELLSHDLQRARIEHYLAAAELVVVPEMFEDTDKSGGKLSRPAFDRALAGVFEGRYGGIAVSRLSRFARTTREALDLIEKIERAGAAFICLDPKIDTSTASGRAILTVFLAFVTLEREQAIEQAALVAEKKLTALAKGEDGCGLGGRPATGYDFEVAGTDTNGKDIRGKLVPNEDSPQVLEAFERFAAGSTPGQVADYLNGAGVLTSRGNRWKIESVRSLLRNEIYTGVRSYGEVRIEGAHEPIVPAPLFRRVQRRLQPKAGPKTRTRGAGHVLGEGLVRCGRCGGGLTKGLANGKYPTLRCLGRGSGHAAISYGKAEDWIVGVAFAHAVPWAVERSGGNAADVEAADAALARAREELAEVEALRGTVSPAAYAVALSDAQAAVEAAEDARDALTVEPEHERLLTALGSRQRFEELPVPEQRRILRQIVSKVVLAPGRGSAAERIEVTFADGTVHPAPFNPAAVPAA
jgi:DNA invertase Pin-like site-specific DNA recombinase